MFPSLTYTNVPSPVGWYRHYNTGGPVRDPEEESCLPVSTRVFFDEGEPRLLFVCQVETGLEKLPDRSPWSE